MNDFMRFDEPGVYDSVKPPGVDQGLIDGFNFLIERRKQLYKDSEIRLLQLRHRRNFGPYRTSMKPNNFVL